MITNTFRDAVASGDVRSVRIMMKDSLLVDRTFSVFEEMGRLAQNMGGLYDPHDGREFKTEKYEWDDSYMDKLMVQIVGNFSHERLAHLKEVVRHLRPLPERSHHTPAQPGTPRDPGTGRTPEPHRTPYRTPSYEEQKRHDQQSGDFTRYGKIAGGAVVGGVVGGAIAGIIGTSVIAGVIAGATVAGVATAIIAK